MRRAILPILLAVLLCALPLPARADLGSATGGVLMLMDAHAEVQYSVFFNADGGIETVFPPLATTSPHRLFLAGLGLTFPLPLDNVQGDAATVNNYAVPDVQVIGDTFYFIPNADVGLPSAAVRDGAFRFDCTADLSVHGVPESLAFTIARGEDPPAPLSMGDATGGVLYLAATPDLLALALDPSQLISATFDRSGTVRYPVAPLPEDRPLYLVGLSLHFPTPPPEQPPATHVTCNGLELVGTVMEDAYACNVITADLPALPENPDGRLAVRIDATLTYDDTPQDIHIELTLP